MPSNLRIFYLAHTLRSDWNNGNAHFLRGLMRSMVKLGHHVTVLEPENAWSIENLRAESLGPQSLSDFFLEYADLDVQTYELVEEEDLWRKRLEGADIVVFHEWNSPELARHLLELREELGFKLLFHDTHHRASSSPEQIQQYGINRFDGVLAFGESLRTIYTDGFNIRRCWVLHEAADITVFRPKPTPAAKQCDVLWIGNWGDGERSSEITDFLLRPAAALNSTARFRIYGVRYPEEGLQALRSAHVEYAGYLPNLKAPDIYAASRLTVHVPRQQYNLAMTGIPTIRVFEALACGIPLISAPWQDTEQLFRPGDICFAQNSSEMISSMKLLLSDPRAAADQTHRGLETILARHTCDHRARELNEICDEVLS